MDEQTNNKEIELVKEPERNIADIFFAWLAFAAGTVFCKLFPVTVRPVGGMIFVFFLFIFGMLIISKKGGRFTWMTVVSAVLAIAIQLSMILTSSEVVHFFAYQYSLLTFMYMMYSAFDNNIEGGYSDFIISDYFKAVIIMPFSSLSFKMTKALSLGLKKKDKSIIGKIVLGLLLAIIPTLAVIGLLSFDEDFISVFKGLFEFNWGSELISWILSLVFGFFVGLYFYGGYISSTEKKCRNTMTAESGRKAYKTIRFLPSLSVSIAIVPILVVYVIFFISQWKYYVGAFGGTLPEDTIYSTYAREGFFQLCIVSVINFFMILLCTVFTKRNGDEHKLPVKIITMITSVFTLILIATALSKMILYIKAYGLTPLRVYTSLFMVFLTVVFIFVMIKLFVKKFRAIPLALLVGFVLFASVGFGMDGFIAKYNVDRYVDGSLSSVDLGTLYDLGDEGAIQLVRLGDIYTEKYGMDFAEYFNLHRIGYEKYQGDFNYDELKTKSFYKEYKELASVLCRYWNSLDLNSGNNSFWNYTVPHARAIKALKKLGYDPEKSK